MCVMKYAGVGKSCVKKIKFDNDFIKFGFSSIYAGNQDSLILWCVICDDVLGIASINLFFFGWTLW